MSRTHSGTGKLLRLFSVALLLRSCGLLNGQQTQLTTDARLPDAPGFLLAQTQQPVPTSLSAGSISGAVADINGGIVPGATVSLIQADRLLTEAKSDSEGHFQFSDVAPGPYRVKIAAPGLESLLSMAINLKPGERYELPTTALPIATANQSVDVVLTPVQIADQELADETKQRVLGVLPNFYTSYEWNAAPLNAKQKYKLTVRATTDPTAFITAGIVAGIEQAHNTFPDYGGGPEGFADRYGAAYGDAFIGRFIGSAILPSIFRQDPRYFYMGPPSTVAQRARHAIAFAFITRGDNGKLQPNYSHIVGNFAAGYISSAYHPSSDKGITLAVDNALLGLAGSAGQALVREFVLKRVSTHTPPYAKGKPVE